MLGIQVCKGAYELAQRFIVRRLLACIVVCMPTATTSSVSLSWTQTSQVYACFDLPLTASSMTNLWRMGDHLEERYTPSLKFEKESWHSRNICWRSKMDLSFNAASMCEFLAFLPVPFSRVSAEMASHWESSATICRIWRGIE